MGRHQLVNKGRMLGKVLSEERARLLPTDLLKSIEGSLTLVENASKDSGKEIINDIDAKQTPGGILRSG